jgi:hypothetical protein
MTSFVGLITGENVCYVCGGPGTKEHLFPNKAGNSRIHLIDSHKELKEKILCSTHNNNSSIYDSAVKEYAEMVQEGIRKQASIESIPDTPEAVYEIAMWKEITEKYFNSRCAKGFAKILLNFAVAEDQPVIDCIIARRLCDSVFKFNKDWNLKKKIVSENKILLEVEDDMGTLPIAFVINNKAKLQTGVFINKHTEYSYFYVNYLNIVSGFNFLYKPDSGQNHLVNTLTTRPFPN